MKKVPEFVHHSALLDAPGKRELGGRQRGQFVKMDAAKWVSSLAALLS